ncbi:LysR substrate-binding domain-containing protein [Phreatobacter stygius]|uniref:LysR family transcriptional regulator n=1 Tax=Phreatobacter stygius TaxID=1940610 RepID=A0A4D7B0R4_9HYPH|nr:LysR substrate-binding domain-containing protein [Phreatobacter stygius]QCI64378.1 LysR family transcriptional regulator [Phreatobacter stygius]
MLDLNDLHFFARIVECKGFTAASRTLGVPKSNLSRRIIRLEQQLGVRLIQRTSRHFVVTEIGQEFYQHCRAVSIEAEEAEHAVNRRLAEPAGLVRLSCPVVFGQHVLAEILPGFMRSYPKVRVVQRLATAGSDLINEGFDVALRVHGPPLASSGLIQRTVCRVQQVLVASPGFVAGLGRLDGPDDLRGVAGLARDAALDEPDWRLRHDDGREVLVPFQPVFYSNDWLVLQKMAVAGFGVAAIPAHACRAELASGALVRLLPDWRGDQASLTLLTPSRRGALPGVRALVEFLLKELPPAIEPGSLKSASAMVWPIAAPGKRDRQS